MKKFTQELEQNYSIEINSDGSANSEINVINDGQIIGSAIYVSDEVDVIYVTSLVLHPQHSEMIFSDGHTLAEVVFKLVLKLPQAFRKQEFRLIDNPPAHLQKYLEKFHFERGAFDSQFLIMRKPISREIFFYPNGITFKKYNSSENNLSILQHLRDHAYWQSHLTAERLSLLLKNSQCFLAFDKDYLVGFARVLTDGNTFASLWDVVISEEYQRKGIGTGLMKMIFDQEALRNIENWLLFTDTAKDFYSKFGFVAIDTESDVKFVYRIRLQESHLSCMPDLMTTLNQSDFPQKIYYE